MQPDNRNSNTSNETLSAIEPSLPFLPNHKVSIMLPEGPD